MAGGRKNKPPPPPPKPSTTLVLDHGASTLKAGLVPSSSTATTPAAAKDDPRVIPNYLARDRHKKVYLASSIDKCRDFGDIQFKRPVEKGWVVNWEVEKEIWDREIFGTDGGKVAGNGPVAAGMDPADMRVLITEPVGSVPVLQSNCDQMVFEEYGFASYARILGPACNAYHDVQGLFRTPKTVPTVANTPAEVMLLVDTGYSSTTVTPLLRGRPIHSAVKRLDIGGKFLTNYLTRLLSLRHFDMRNESYIVNEMKEQVCYVTSDFKADLETCWKGTKGDRRQAFLTGGGIAKDYVLPDFHTRMKGEVLDYDPARHSKARKLLATGQPQEDFLTLRNERFTVPELIFRPSDSGIRQPGLADLIQQSLQELPFGLWPGLLANIVVVGGNSLFDGLIQRLQKEVVQRFPDDCVVRVARPADPVVSTWRGAANLANHPNIEKMVVTKKEYEEQGGAWVARKFAEGLPLP